MINNSQPIYQESIAVSLDKWQRRYRDLQNLIDALLSERDTEDDPDLRRALLNKINQFRAERDLIAATIQNIRTLG